MEARFFLGGALCSFLSGPREGLEVYRCTRKLRAVSFLPEFFYEVQSRAFFPAACGLLGADDIFRKLIVGRL